MNLQVIESTWNKIEAEAEKIGVSTSQFVRNMIFDWHNNCMVRKIPEFKNTKSIIKNISTNTEERKAIKHALIIHNITHKQLIEAAWTWYQFQKEKK